MIKQPTVRQINEHLQGGTKYCYVYNAEGNCLMRISRARTRQGVVEGRVIGYFGRGAYKPWHVIPTDASIALTDY
jgi:hypothetical protein